MAGGNGGKNGGAGGSTLGQAGGAGGSNGGGGGGASGAYGGAGGGAGGGVGGRPGGVGVDGTSGGPGTGTGGGGGGGGGGAGYRGTGGALSASGASFTGTAGGSGGNGSYAVGDGNGNYSGGGGGGGGGGAGGYGAVLLGANVTTAASLTGGKGGGGGGAGYAGYAGVGGEGGTGLAATASASGITNTGSIKAGQGGQSKGIAGAGGTGVRFLDSGTSGTLTNSGTINGGDGGLGITTGSAGRGGAGVAFAGGGSTLTNQATGSIGGGNGGRAPSSPNDAGAGVSFAASGGKVINAGVIQGGIGGFGNYRAASGGAGIYGAGMTIANAGRIVGGLGSVQGNAVTFTGGANVLAVGAGASFVGALNIQSGTLTFNQSAGTDAGIAADSDATVATPITGAGAVIKADTGTLTFTGAKTYTGGTTVSAGTLQLGDGSTNGSVAGAITDNSVLALDPNGTQTFANTVSGSGALSKTGAGTTVLTAVNTYAGGTTLGGGTLSVGADTALGATSGALSFNGGTLQVTGTTFTATARSIAWGAGGGGFDIANAGNNFTVSQTLGGGALTKTGAGTLTLSGANTYTGGTTLGAGTVSVGADANLGAASGALAFNGGTLQVTGTAFTTTGRGITWGASGGGFDIADAGNTFTVARNLTGGALTKLGAGTLTLSGQQNGYTGGTFLNAGRLSVSADTNLGDGSGGLTFAGGTLQTTQSFDTKRTVTLNGAGTVQTDSGVTNFRGAITNGAATGSLAKSGAGTLVLSNGSNTYSGGTLIQSGTLQLTQVQAAGTGAISFQAGVGGSATLVINGAAQPSSGTFANTLDSFGDGDALDLKGFAFNAVSTTATYDPAGRILSVTNGTATQTFNMTNADPDDSGAYYAHDDGAGGTRVDNVVCFATGTMIRTVHGDVPVETLKLGDRAVTASGAVRPIRWIGTRSFDCAAHPEPAMVRPIRIAAGAFGAGRPYCDLTLSPHHAVAVTCLDEVLIPIRLLVNGSSIKQIEEARAVTYWHVELDSHDILLANGLPAESYIDVGNRCDFEGEASLTLHPRFASDPLAAYCRPLVTGSGVLAAVRSQLAALVAEDAVASTAPFNLLVDGKMIAPVVKGDAAAFAIPAGTKDIRLVSPAWSPRDRDPGSSDDRTLGLMIQALSVEDLFGTATAIALDDPGLAAGFHPPERNATGRWRWTDGDALIDASSLGETAGPFVMRLSGRFAASPRIDRGAVAAAA